MVWYWLFKHVFIGPALRVVARPKVTGLENIPEGAALLVSNHLAVVDSFYLPLMVPRRIYFLAKAEYFEGTGIKGAFKRWFFGSTGQIPINRTGADAAAAALVAARSKLDSGDLMCLYPEGTRSVDGRLYKGKTGAARIALATGVPVLPVAMVNTEKLNPPGTVLPRLAKIEIRIGKPLDFSRYEGMGGHRFIERAITDEIMYELMNLSGQDYVDVYAASLKNPRPADPAVPPVTPAA